MKYQMKKYLVGVLAVFITMQAEATTTLEKNIVECTISSNQVFEEIILKFVQTQDADDYVYEDYVLDYTFGEMSGDSVDIIGAHEQIRHRLFTSAIADGDGVIANGREDYVMIAQYEHSELIVHLTYEGQDQDDFPTYTMSFEGEGPVYELVVERVQDVLAESEHYNRYDNPLCTSHFDLNEFVSQ